MFATFCVRLALGLLACLLLLLPARQLHPRFFRTHFLTALGLLVVATLSAWPEAGDWLRGLLAAGTVLALLGALSWTLDPAPAGRVLIVLTSLTLTGALWLLHLPESWTFYTPNSTHTLPGRSLLALAGDLTSAALLGTAVTAMLIGHSYLIAPGMSLAPLMRLLAALGVAILLRAIVAGIGLWCWTGTVATYTLNNETVLWLPVRWLVGVVAPLVFGGMAYASARIRSTQSATGILYVAVVCGFLGELLSLLLTRQTGLPL
jgi:hypothetical protein